MTRTITAGLLGVLLAACSAAPTIPTRPAGTQPPEPTDTPQPGPTGAPEPTETLWPTAAAATPVEPPPTSTLFPPDLFLLLPNNQTVKGMLSNFCWCGDGPPPEVQRAVLGADRVIRLRFAEPVPARVQLELRASSEAVTAAEFELLGDTLEWAPDAPPGDYNLRVGAHWDSLSDAYYWFKVTIP